MPRHKKRFPCGHLGFGQFCHSCEDAKKKLELEREKNDEANAWKIALRKTPIPLDHLPKSAAIRTVSCIEMMAAGEPINRFNGKRLTLMNQRDIISVPVGLKYRLIGRMVAKYPIQWIEVISHETYNQRLSSGGWK